MNSSQLLNHYKITRSNLDAIYLDKYFRVSTMRERKLVEILACLESSTLTEDTLKHNPALVRLSVALGPRDHYLWQFITMLSSAHS